LFRFEAIIRQFEKIQEGIQALKKEIEALGLLMIWQSELTRIDPYVEVRKCKEMI
jgi:hypothetical protein